MKKTSILLSAPFWFALILLLINDFYLKYQFSNFLTGKISDFAGLFIFPIYFSVLFPQARKFIHFATAFLFLGWKSAYSSDFIAIWNEYAPFSIARTIDFSDNIALIMIPLAYFYWEKYENQIFPKAYLYFSLGLSFFAFTATSKPYQEPEPRKQFSFYNTSYLLHIQEDSIHKRLLEAHYNVLKRAHRYDVNMPDARITDIRFELTDSDSGTCNLTLQQLATWHYWYDTFPALDSLKMQKMFEAKFIDSLLLE